MEELPECPVCLQSYDCTCTIPRVLTCGHTACETCLLNLPQKFPQTVRCPACTVLVKYPPQGPTFLPKNIDLLRLVNPSSPQTRKNSDNSRLIPEFDFIPRFWSDELYSFWKQYILPSDAVLVEGNFEEEDGFRVGCLKERESQRVSLVKVGSLFSSGEDGSVFKYSYFTRVMNCLSGIREEERDELDLILKATSERIKFCRVLGLWGDMEDGFLCLVCDRLNQIENLDFLRDGDYLNENGLSSFAMMGMEICEALIGLNKLGLITGCLGFTCFNFDNFGHLYVDLNGVLAMGRRVAKGVAKVGSVGGRTCNNEVELFLSDLLASNVFLSPEVLYDLLKNGAAVQPECGESSVGYGSDVWSLACVLLSLLFGEEFTNELVDYIHCVSTKVSEDNSLNYSGMYMTWIEKVIYLLESKFGSDFLSLQQIFSQCLNFDSASRPPLTNVWKCIRELIINPEFDKMIRMDEAVSLENEGHCLVLGELCRLPKGRLEETAEKDNSLGEENSDGADIDRGEEARVVEDLVEGVSDGNVKFKEMQGHRDCVTGLAVGGGFLFSSSFDKSILVWSLQDFSHAHTFNGHEQKVTALVYVDEEQPLCISGDSGGGIFVWSISFPLGQGPLKKWNEQKDWRYSGIHALTVSGRYLYTGSGDKTIKAWSLPDGTLSCSMSGHKSVVSTLTVCNGVLYSGSWDGTIRLWSLSDHSLLTVLGEDRVGAISSVLSLAADQHILVASHESGSIKIWRNDVFMKSMQPHKGSIFALCMEGKWLFTGGWDKTVSVQELTGDEFQVDTVPIGSIPCVSVITALLYWQGNLFVGYADRTIKVYYYGK